MHQMLCHHQPRVQLKDLDRKQEKRTFVAAYLLTLCSAYSHLVDLRYAVFTQEAIAMRAIKINRLSFVTASSVWRVSLPISAVGLDNFHHLLVKQVGWETVDIFVRTFGDLTTCRTTQFFSGPLMEPIFQT